MLGAAGSAVVLPEEVVEQTLNIAVIRQFSTMLVLLALVEMVEVEEAVVWVAIPNLGQEGVLEAVVRPEVEVEAELKVQGTISHQEVVQMELPE